MHKHYTNHIFYDYAKNWLKMCLIGRIFKPIFLRIFTLQKLEIFITPWKPWRYGKQPLHTFSGLWYHLAILVQPDGHLELTRWRHLTEKLHILAHDRIEDVGANDANAVVWNCQDKVNAPTDRTH